MRDLPHLVGQVFNTPLMIATPKLDTVLGAVGKRILSGDPIAETQRPEPRAEFASARNPFQHGGYLCDGGIGVLPILGTLIRRGSWLDSMSGLTSYAAVSAAIYEMAESPSVRGIMLEVDSFGGEAGGCFDLVNEIVAVTARSRKPVWAIANEAAASAAYAIACAADRIWLPQMGIVGSVGVVCAHVDMSEADKMDGRKWTYIFAGDHKVDGNPHEPLPASVKSDLLADVNQIYREFTAVVAKRRGLSSDAVRATGARMFRGKGAVQARLADQVGTLAEAMRAFAAHLNGQPRARARGNQGAISMTVRTDAERRAATAASWDCAVQRVAARHGVSALETGADTGRAKLAAQWNKHVLHHMEREQSADASEPSAASAPVTPVQQNGVSDQAALAASWERAIQRAAEKRGQSHQS